MASLNKVLLIGNLGKDPETRYLPSGGAVCNFSIATTDRYKDKQGQQQEKTEWHNHHHVQPPRRNCRPVPEKR